MDGWWNELDHDLLSALDCGRAMSPAKIGAKLGISETAVESLLTVLAAEGKIRICLVERPE